MPAGASSTEDATVASPPLGQTGWTAYILECADGTFYTGITNDVGRRLTQHNDGCASRYTRGRGPVRVVYREPCGSRSAALIREAAIKSLSRREKESLIKKKTRKRTSLNQPGDQKR